MLSEEKTSAALGEAILNIMDRLFLPCILCTITLYLSTVGISI